MKKTLFIIIVAVLVLTVGVLSVNQYQEYKNKKTQETAAKADEVVAVKTAAVAAQKSLADQYGALHVECEKGAAAYAQLTAFAKNKVPAPACGPAVPTP